MLASAAPEATRWWNAVTVLRGLQIVTGRRLSRRVMICHFSENKLKLALQVRIGC